MILYNFNVLNNRYVINSDIKTYNINNGVFNVTLNKNMLNINKTYIIINKFKYNFLGSFNFKCKCCFFKEKNIIENKQLLIILIIFLEIIGKKKLGKLLLNITRSGILIYINYITEKLKIIKDYIISLNPFNVNTKIIEEVIINKENIIKNELLVSSNNININTNLIEEILINKENIIKNELLIVEKVSDLVNVTNSYLNTNYIIGGIVLAGIGIVTYCIYKQFFFINNDTQVKVDEYVKLHNKLVDLLKEHSIYFDYSNLHSDGSLRYNYFSERKDKYTDLYKTLIYYARIDDAVVVKFFLIEIEDIMLSEVPAKPGELSFTNLEELNIIGPVSTDIFIPKMLKYIKTFVMKDYLRLYENLYI